MSVSMLTTVPDLPEIQRRLTNAERSVFTKHEKILLDAVKKRWRDWNYQHAGPQYRNPALHAWDVSVKAWRSTNNTTIGSRPALLLINDIEYAGFVHRTGTAVIEWEAIWDDVWAQYGPALQADLKTAIEAALNAPGPVKRRGATGGGTTVRAGGTVI